MSGSRLLSQRPIGRFSDPLTVAVIGATEAEPSVGRTVLENLRSFPGTVYPVNPNRSHALGRKCYPSIGALPETVDMAVIVTPAATVPGIVVALRTRPSCMMTQGEAIEVLDFPRFCNLQTRLPLRSRLERGKSPRSTSRNGT
jgi:predicted CoA-binding protein